ncbi:MAG: N-acetylmuramoyl-L-alanine amidase [Burkholderiales bacterium]|nr:N-acetylmuramoyl-L-alanine amidase [Burkholderiales bacterium]
MARILTLPILASLALLAACAGPTPRPQMDARIAGVVEVDAWGGQPLAAVTRTHRVTRITVHHQGEVWPSAQRPDDDPVAYLKRLQSWSRLSKRWIDIPYHYIIAPDGRVFATRDPGTPGDTNTEYDPSGHALLMLMGNFDVQQPTPAQLGAAVALMTELARRHGLSEAAIASHKDYSAQTSCPGQALYALLPELRSAVARQLQGR